MEDRALEIDGPSLWNQASRAAFAAAISTNGPETAMHSIFYIIGVVVVVIAILSFLGLG